MNLRIKKILSFAIMFILICCSLLGCNSGKRTKINQARLYNNEDDVKIVGLHKVVTIEGRDYYVIYCNFKNNTDERLENIQFDFEITDKVNEMIGTGTFEIERIEPGKTVLGDYFMKITDETSIENIGSIIFTDFQHEGTKGSVNCTREIEFDFGNIRIEEME